MDRLEELASDFLFSSSMEFERYLDRVTGEVVYDDEMLTGEPGIDWDSEEAENLEPLPVLHTPEAFEIRMLFAKEQAEPARSELKEALGRKKPFRNFREQVERLGIEQAWYDFEMAYGRKRIEEWLEQMEIELRDDPK